MFDGDLHLQSKFPFIKYCLVYLDIYEWKPPAVLLLPLNMFCYEHAQCCCQ